MHHGKRAFKVLDQLGEPPLYRARTRDQNIIIFFDRGCRSYKPHRLLEPPPCAVARDSAAQALGGGEAKARNMVIVVLIRNTAARLQDERGRNEARSTLHMQKLGAGLETSDGRHRFTALPALCRQALAPLGSPPREHLAPAFGRHTSAEAVALLADEPRRLVGAFHGATPGSILRSERPASGSAIPGLIGCCARSSQSIPREFRDSAEPTGHRRLRLPTMPRVPRSSRVSQKSDNHQLSPQCGCQSPPRGVLTFRFCSAAIQRIEYPSFCISRIIGSSCFARSRAPPRIWEEHPVFIEEKSRFGGFPLPGYLEPHRKLLSASYAAPSYRS